MVNNTIIVGGGLFGLTIAIILAENGINVTVLEKNLDVLKEASLVNQNRIHYGYHYPRSTETGRESIELPTSWQYKSELPMNGGSMNGIYGFDNLESQFASFNDNSVNGNDHANGTQVNLQPSNDNNFKNIPHNDLRKPVVYN